MNVFLLRASEWESSFVAGVYSQFPSTQEIANRYVANTFYDMWTVEEWTVDGTCQATTRVVVDGKLLDLERK